MKFSICNHAFTVATTTIIGVILCLGERAILLWTFHNNALATFGAFGITAAYLVAAWAFDFFRQGWRS